MANFGWHYPPGATGNEYAIAGPDYEQELDEPCPQCGALALVEEGYRGNRWATCDECDYQYDIPADEPDPDSQRDKRTPNKEDE